MMLHVTPSLMGRDSSVKDRKGPNVFCYSNRNVLCQTGISNLANFVPSKNRFLRQVEPCLTDMSKTTRNVSGPIAGQVSLESCATNDMKACKVLVSIVSQDPILMFFLFTPSWFRTIFLSTVKQTDCCWFLQMPWQQIGLLKFITIILMNSILKFPSNLNCHDKIISEMGPRVPMRLLCLQHTARNGALNLWLCYHITAWRTSAKPSYLQYWCPGDTTVMHKALSMGQSFTAVVVWCWHNLHMIFFIFQWRCIFMKSTCHK